MNFEGKKFRLLKTNNQLYYQQGYDSYARKGTLYIGTGGRNHRDRPLFRTKTGDEVYSFTESVLLNKSYFKQEGGWKMRFE